MEKIERDKLVDMDFGNILGCFSVICAYTNRGVFSLHGNIMNI